MGNDFNITAESWDDAISINHSTSPPAFFSVEADRVWDGFVYLRPEIAIEANSAVEVMDAEAVAA